MMSWVAIAVTMWMGTSVPLALLVGASIRTGAAAPVRTFPARRSPAHVRYGLGCSGLRAVPDIA